MLATLSQVCTLHAPFEKDLEDYAAGACRAVELWLGKLETYLQSHSLRQVRELVAEYQLSLPAASYQGGLFVAEGAARDAHWAHFQRRLQLCEELDIRTLIVAGDLAGPLDSAAFDRLRDSLHEAAERAVARGVRLAFEFQAGASFANNLQTAASLIAEISKPNLGICLDAFHFYNGPSKTEDLGLLTTENLFHVQLSDVAGVPREWAKDADRILPGDGDFPLAPLIKRLQTIAYEGAVSVELMNPQMWQISPRQFGEIAITALRKILGQAQN
ncbi:MAG TPA: sugar phosphate isomerase/epimerase family protein [Pirellulales bacterium]|jgi:sugar phosphate isomerase/epimerase|nr:sugar phosphate isomerase/epimerase family protein [Pirellulales bacterium]